MGALRKGEINRTEIWIEYLKPMYSCFNDKLAILELWEGKEKSILPIPSDSIIYEWESLTEDQRVAISKSHYVDSGSKASAMKLLPDFPAKVWRVIPGGVLTKKQAWAYSEKMQENSRFNEDESLPEFIQNEYEWFHKLLVKVCKLRRAV